MSDRREELARQIRTVCGQHNNDMLPVITVVRDMAVRIEELTTLLGDLLSAHEIAVDSIRAALREKPDE